MLSLILNPSPNLLKKSLIACNQFVLLKCQLKLSSTKVAGEREGAREFTLSSMKRERSSKKKDESLGIHYD